MRTMRSVSEASSGSLLRSTIDAASSLLIYSTVTSSAALQADLAKAAEGNKAAAARARKETLELEKLGKAFRKQSIAEL